MPYGKLRGLDPEVVLCAGAAAGLDTFTFCLALGLATQCGDAVRYARAIGDNLSGKCAVSIYMSRKAMNKLAHALNGNMLSPVQSTLFPETHCYDQADRVTSTAGFLGGEQRSESPFPAAQDRSPSASSTQDAVSRAGHKAKTKMPRG